MIRVLIVETTVFGYDGITNVIANYFTHIDHKKIQMDIVTINSVDERFKAAMERYGRVNYVISCRNNNPLKYIISLAKIARNGRYQIMHVHGCSATMAVEMLAARLAGIKVRIAHSHNTRCDHVLADRLLRPFFDRWHTHSFACGKEAGEWLFPKKRFSIISNGIDLDKFQFNSSMRGEMRKKNNLEGKFVIGHVGRFSEQKNHAKLIEIFMEAAKKIPNSKLVLVGDGELRKKVEQTVLHHRIDVLFVGLSNEVEKWLQAMDVMVFPSLFEGLPLGLIEAQAAGLPCILSNSISPAIKVTDLIEFVDLDASVAVWSDAIKRNKDRYDRDKRNDLIKEQIRSSHFDIKENCEELAKKYEDLLKDGVL